MTKIAVIFRILALAALARYLDGRGKNDRDFAVPKGGPMADEQRAWVVWRQDVDGSFTFDAAGFRREPGQAVARVYVWTRLGVRAFAAPAGQNPNDGPVSVVWTVDADDVAGVRRARG